MEKLNLENFQFPENDEQFYETNDIAISRLSNESSLKEAFYERAKYKFQGSPILLPDGFDFIETNFFFGKVDTNGRVIVPKLSSLITVNPKYSNDEEVYINKDLYQLYKDFFNTTKYIVGLGRDRMDLALGYMQIVKGAELPAQVEKDYVDHASELIFEAYEDFILNEAGKDKSLNFDSYLKTIYSLFKEQRLGKEILYSEYILSSKNSLLNSGLAYEVTDDEQYDDNYQKFANYYGIIEYNKLISYAFLSGIRYDKNVPWRYFIDLNLPEAQSQAKSSSYQDYFDKNFDVVDGTEKEFYLLFYSLFKSYLRLTSEEPVVYFNDQILKTCSKSSYKVNRSYSLERKILTERQFEKYFKENYNNNNLIYYYVDIINSIFKSNKNINKLKFNIERILKKGLDRKSVIEYTYNTLKNCSKQTRRKNVLSNTSKQGISSRSSY